MVIPGWATQAEKAGFSTLGTVGRVAYLGVMDTVALAAAAAATTSIGLLSTVMIDPAWPEILMLRHQLLVALRERPRAHSRLTWPDRAWLALLAGTLPIDRLAAMRLIVRPAPRIVFPSPTGPQRA